MPTHTAKLQWHPAFGAALRIEFGEELDMLDIRDEYPLSKKPLLMDILIVKKEQNIAIRKNIGRIFRLHNIIEYKSPEDYLSINDFYKVYGYTCLYQSDTPCIMEIDPAELTITFICSHYPRELIHHLKNSRNIDIQKQEDGIYYLSGDPFPIQLLITKELSKEENYWLHNLRNDLHAGSEIQDLIKHYEPNKSSLYHQTVMDLITRANWEQMEEENKMCDALLELLADELKDSKEAGIKEGELLGIKKGELAGIKKGELAGINLAKTVFKLSVAGSPPCDIAKQCNIPEQRVLEILE